MRANFVCLGGSKKGGGLFGFRGFSVLPPPQAECRATSSSALQMPAVLPKAPKACLEVWRGRLLEVPSSTSCAKSRNRRSPNEIRVSSRSPRLFRGEEGLGICCLANWHAIGYSKAPKGISENSRPAGKGVGN